MFVAGGGQVFVAGVRQCLSHASATCFREFPSWPCEPAKSSEPRPDRGDPERSTNHLVSGNCGTKIYLVRGTSGHLISCFYFFAIFCDFSRFFGFLTLFLLFFGDLNRKNIEI